MNFKRFAYFLPVLLLAGMFPAQSAAQTDKPKFGLGISAGTLGVGIQAATAVTRKANLRVGVNAFQYSDSFDKDGIHYTGTLKLRSAQATFDQYLGGGFHISPGVLLYNDNKGTAVANVPGGQTFTLSGAQFYSNAANPVTGNGTLTLNKVAPMILIGFGNLLPRSSRHFGVNFDVGVVFQGAAKVGLNLAGTACGISATLGCVNAGTDPTIQTKVAGEQVILNDYLKPFQYYPVVALTLSYKF